jgi:hypothetical protein
MSSHQFALILTNGTHSISEETAGALLDALESGVKTVQIQADLYGEGSPGRTILLAVAHVVAIVKPSSHSSIFDEDEKVRPLFRDR